MACAYKFTIALSLCLITEYKFCGYPASVFKEKLARAHTCTETHRVGCVCVRGVQQTHQSA